MRHVVRIHRTCVRRSRDGPALHASNVMVRLQQVNVFLVVTLGAPSKSGRTGQAPGKESPRSCQQYPGYYGHCGKSQESVWGGHGSVVQAITVFGSEEKVSQCLRKPSLYCICCGRLRHAFACVVGGKQAATKTSESSWQRCTPKRVAERSMSEPRLARSLRKPASRLGLEFMTSG